MKQQTLHLVRNMMHPEYCPVLQMMLWLKILAEHGIHCGPLFPFIDNGHTNFAQPLEYIKTEQWEKWVAALFVYVGGELHECTSHSIRRSSVKWAARCGAAQHDILQGGRWVHNSDAFQLYIRDGVLKSKELLAHLGAGGVDPIFKFWVWVPTVFEMVGAG
jgi:hypothetical protein